jgi:hypothetical protein
MRIANPRHFALGLGLSLSFLAVLAVIFAPIFGAGRNGLEYADDVFNQLSKGSSYFIPKVAQQAGKLTGKPFSVIVKAEGEQGERAARLLAAAGVTVEVRPGSLAVSGDLGKLLGVVLGDAEAGFRNDEEALAGRYGLPGRTVLATWWSVLKQMSKGFAAARQTDLSDGTVAVMKKAIEPAHNYYGIEAESVGNMLGTMTALLTFYVLYTIWWGSGIYYLFEGVGLIMRKEPERPPAEVVVNTPS